MPRRPRVVIEGGLYHVYNRFARGEPVFADPGESIEFVELLREVKRRDGLTVLAWAVMPNHFHLALRTSAVPLARSMRHLQGRYSRAFNRRWKRSGALWQSRYHARYIANQGYMDQVMVYVHLNPVRAGLVDEPAEYAFSGHRELLGKVRNPLVDVDHALVGFGDTLRRGRRQYLSRVRVAMEQDAKALPEDGPSLSSFVSDDRDLEPDHTASVDVLGRSTGLERPPLDAVQYLEIACQVIGSDLARLASSRKDSGTAMQRRLVAAVGIERWGQSAGRMAAVLRKHSVTVSRWVAEAAELRQTDPALADRLAGLDSGLSRRALQLQASGKLSDRSGTS